MCLKEGEGFIWNLFNLLSCYIFVWNYIWFIIDLNIVWVLLGIYLNYIFCQVLIQYEMIKFLNFYTESFQELQFEEKKKKVPLRIAVYIIIIFYIFWTFICNHVSNQLCYSRWQYYCYLIHCILFIFSHHQSCYCIGKFFCPFFICIDLCNFFPHTPPEIFTCNQTARWFYLFYMFDAKTWYDFLVYFSCLNLVAGYCVSRASRVLTTIELS